MAFVMTRCLFRSCLVLLFLVCATVPSASGQSKYLPLRPGNRWVLRHPSVPQPITIEVLERSGNEYHVRFSSPFGNNEWMLRPEGESYYLTKYGGNGQLAPLPADTLYFDFAAKAHQQWSNVIGNISVDATGVSVRALGDSFSGCIRIRQSKKMSFTFAAGTGFVEFGEGKDAFVLAVSESVFGETDRAKANADDSMPAPHVPSPASENSAPITESPGVGRSDVMPKTGAGHVLFSITPNTFANQAQTPQNLLEALGIVERAGLNFLVHNGKWNELEPKKGEYNFEPLDFNVATAKRLHIPICYTLRTIETVDRAVPSEFRKMPWSDPRMEQALLKLIEAMAPHFDGRVHWFLLGNEIDGYFTRHPGELDDYARLYDHLARRIKQLAPGIQVSATLMFGGVELMNGAMRPLTEQFDFVCFTYYPIRGDFTMQDPSLVSHHVDRMRKVAHGRPLVLQEVGFASGAKNNSSQEMQAQFVENVFTVLRANSDFVEAACFWLLADLQEDFVDKLAGYYGMPNSAVFKSFLQTLGMFDGSGNPKKAWSVYEREVRTTN
jgi:hypothetical protein